MASYKFLSNKPKINSVEVLGNKELKDYNLTPIMYDDSTRFLYTVLTDGTRVNIKAVSQLPVGYTSIDAIVLNANAVSAVMMPIGGDLEWNATLAWSVNASQQCIGFALAANAYIGITANGEVSAEWSIADRGVPGSDPTAKNTIHAKFVSGQMTELTIDGFATTSYGYPNGFANYNDYSSFGLNIAPGGGIVSVTYWHTDFVKNGETIIDLYPCKRDSDNAIGLYDIIAGVFYPIAGATEV